MCFSAPKPPKVPDPDPELAFQKEAARAAAASSAAQAKSGALRVAVSRQTGNFGIRSLLGGSGSARGFGSSLLL